VQDETQDEVQDEVQDETQDNTQTDVADEDQSAQPEAQDDQDDQDEELIPKSKIQKRIDKFKSEAEYWKNKYNTDVSQAKETPKDDTSKKLEAMSETELRNLKREVRLAQIKSKDDTSMTQLLDLEDKIDETLRTAPQKFSEKQVNYYNQVAQEIASNDDFKDEDAPEILKIAKDIYSSEPDLQKSVSGQGVALRLAAKHFKEKVRLSQRAKETPKLKGQINSFKKVTALDTKGVKGNNDSNIVSNLLRKSRNSGLTNKEKVTLITNDPRFNIDALIPKD